MVASVAASSFVLFHAARSLKLLRMMPRLPRIRVGNFGVKKIFVARRLLRNYFNTFATRIFSDLRYIYTYTVTLLPHANANSA